MTKRTTAGTQIPGADVIPVTRHLAWCADSDDPDGCGQADHELYMHREPWFLTLGEHGDVALRLRLNRRDWADGRRDEVGVQAFISIDGEDPTDESMVAILTPQQARAWGATLIAFAERATP